MCQTIIDRLWHTPFVEQQKPQYKYLYMMLCVLCVSQLGILFCDTKRLAFESGLSKKTVEKGLEAFAASGQVLIEDESILVLEYLSCALGYERDNFDFAAHNASLQHLYRSCQSSRFQEALRTRYPALFANEEAQQKQEIASAGLETEVLPVFQDQADREEFELERTADADIEAEPLATPDFEEELRDLKISSSLLLNAAKWNKPLALAVAAQTDAKERQRQRTTSTLSSESDHHLEPCADTDALGQVPSVFYDAHVSEAQKTQIEQSNESFLQEIAANDTSDAVDACYAAKTDERCRR